MSKSALQIFAQAFRGFRADAADLKTVEQFEQWKNLVGTTPFTNIAKRIMAADLTSGQAIEIPEAELTLHAGKPLDNIKNFEKHLKDEKVGPSVQGAYNKLKHFFEENSPKLLAAKAKLANPPSDSEYFDLANKEEAKPINWEFFKRKGVPEKDIQQLKTYIDEQQAKLQNQQEEFNSYTLEVAGVLDKIVQSSLSDWACQPNNLRKLINHAEKEKEEYEFLMTASVNQILERYPDIAEKINQKILNREWAAFEAPDDPRWEALKNFVPKYPADHYAEHAAHHGEKHH